MPKLSSNLFVVIKVERINSPISILTFPAKQSWKVCARNSRISFREHHIPETIGLKSMNYTSNKSCITFD